MKEMHRAEYVERITELSCPLWTGHPPALPRIHQPRTSPNLFIQSFSGISIT